MKKFAAGLEVGRPNSGKGRGEIPALPFSGRMIGAECGELPRMEQNAAGAVSSGAAVTSHPLSNEHFATFQKFLDDWLAQNLQVIAQGGPQ